MDVVSRGRWMWAVDVGHDISNGMNDGYGYQNS